MGRHAAQWPVPDSAGSEDRPRFAGGRLPLHADLFAPNRGRAAATDAAERAAEAFDRLVQPHRSALEAYVERLTDGDDALADSIVKETLYRAAQDPARFPQRSSAVRPWLVLTARAVLNDGERYAPAGHDDRPAPAPRATGTTIVGALDELSGTHRELLVELFYDGRTVEDAADARGVPVETVRSGLYFAMRALRTVLDQQLTDRHGPHQ